MYWNWAVSKRREESIVSDDYSAQLIVCRVTCFIEYDNSTADDFRNGEASMKILAVVVWHSRTIGPYFVSNIIHVARCVSVIGIFMPILFP